MKGIEIKNNSSLFINQSYEGESIETKVERIVTNNEPISDGAPLIYTDRKEGVLPQYDIRTDRWDIAVEAMGSVAIAEAAKRDGTPVTIEQVQTVPAVEN